MSRCARPMLWGVLLACFGACAAPTAAQAWLTVRASCPGLRTRLVQHLLQLELAPLMASRPDLHLQVAVNCDGGDVRILVSPTGGTLRRLLPLRPDLADRERIIALAAAQMLAALQLEPLPAASAPPLAGTGRPANHAGYKAQQRGPPCREGTEPMSAHHALLATVAGAGLLAASPLASGRPLRLAHPLPRTAGSSIPATGEVQELVKEMRGFFGAAEDYRRTMSSIVLRSYQKRRQEMLGRYEEQIRREEEEERVLRLSAITMFEDFLRRYPDDRRWTPDVIFRLAELYFAKSNDEYLQAEEWYQRQALAYEKELEAFNAGRSTSRPAAPAPPGKDYTQTIRLQRRLIREFPRYRLIDGAHYLLGFCLAEMGSPEQGNQAYLALVCANRYRPPLEERPSEEEGAEGEEAAGPAAPRSRLPSMAVTAAIPRPELDTGVYDECRSLLPGGRFYSEAWIRIGEHHFDNNQLGQAIAAYSRVTGLGPRDNPYFDEALYKLAWTHYRADRFLEAIRHFDELVLYSDREHERTGKRGSEMRPESIQYLGISFAEEDWDGDTLPDTESGLVRIERFYASRINERHVYEVYRRLADIYLDIGRHDDAVKVYRLVLQRWPLGENNPEVQDRVILALERQRRFDEAMTEREELSRLFGKGTSWELHNRGNPKAVRKARELEEQALIQAAVHHHRRGQESRARGVAMKDGALLQQAAREYALAARAYERYLERFTNTKNSYEIRHSHASCLFYSQRFFEAGQVFGEVRDSNLDNRYQEEAAFSAAKAYEEHIGGQVREGKLPDPPLPRADGSYASLAPRALPDAYRKWQEALDAYARLLPRSSKTPRLTYKAAEISFCFFDFDDARKRFDEICNKHPKDAMALNAARAVLVTYQLEKNLEKVEEWALKLRDHGGDADPLIVGLRFTRAQELMQMRRYDRAASAFLALVDANPGAAEADAALNNAAICQEKDRRFESATRIYQRLWQQYPQSRYADEALWRSAINYQRQLEFGKAVSNFLILADSPRFKGSTHRNDSIYNAAVILESDQAYSRAAGLFLRYASVMGRTDEAAAACFRAGEIYSRMKDHGSMVRTLSDFARTYGSLPGQAGRVVEALSLVGGAARRRNDWRAAEKHYRLAIKEFHLRGLKPASDAAEHAASAAFELAEHRLEHFLSRSISGAIGTLPRQESRMAKEALALREEYDRIWSYKRARWTLAAMSRAGTIYEHFARAVDSAYRNAPIPARVRRLGREAIDYYLGKVDELLARQVDPIVERAKRYYLACVKRGRGLGVSSRYTRMASERLNALDPVRYPLLKRARVERTID